MSRYITRAELARRGGVHKSNAGRACTRKLRDAVSKKGVDTEHPLIVEWLAAHGDEAVTLGIGAGLPDPHAAHALENLDTLTVREVVMRYGSVDGFKRFVDSLKSIAEFKFKELKAKQQRGDLIERRRVAGLVFPLIDMAFTRLVSDVPSTLSQLVVARVQSGGSETLIDVERMIREANGRVLKNLKKAVTETGVLQDAD